MYCRFRQLKLFKTIAIFLYRFTQHPLATLYPANQTLQADFQCAAIRPSISGGFWQSFSVNADTTSIIPTI